MLRDVESLPEEAHVALGRNRRIHIDAVESQPGKSALRNPRHDGRQGVTSANGRGHALTKKSFLAWRLIKPKPQRPPHFGIDVYIDSLPKFLARHRHIEWL